MFKIGKGGVLVDAKTGEKVLVEGQEINLQDLVDEQLQDRLQRQKEQFEAKLKGSISAQEREQLEAKISDLESQMQNADQRATAKAEKAVKDLQDKLQATEERARGLEEHARKTRMENELVAAATACKFIKPTDLVREVRDSAQWEEVKGADGKATGEFKLGFKLGDKVVTAEEAAKAIATDNKHLIQGSALGGYGGDVGGGGGAGDRAPGTLQYASMPKS